MIDWEAVKLVGAVLGAVATSITLGEKLYSYSKLAYLRCKKFYSNAKHLKKSGIRRPAIAFKKALPATSSPLFKKFPKMLYINVQTFKKVSNARPIEACNLCDPLLTCPNTQGFLKTSVS